MRGLIDSMNKETRDRRPPQIPIIFVMGIPKRDHHFGTLEGRQSNKNNELPPTLKPSLFQDCGIRHASSVMRDLGLRTPCLSLKYTCAILEAFFLRELEGFTVRETGIDHGSGVGWRFYLQAHHPYHSSWD